jgi:hypothetical protein
MTMTHDPLPEGLKGCTSRILYKAIHSKPLKKHFFAAELECELRTLRLDLVLKYTAIDRRVSRLQSCS